MPRFRWSDNVANAVEFTADRSSFVDRAIDAALDARLKTCKRSHKGEYRATLEYCPALELHLRIGDQWMRLGRVVDTSFGPKSAWLPEGFALPILTKWITQPQKGEWPGAGHWPPASESLGDDAAFIREQTGSIWERVEDTQAWGRALDSFIGDFIEETFPE